jgi:hypothetical protein
LTLLLSLRNFPSLWQENPRVHFTGALYHVMCRGNQGQAILFKCQACLIDLRDFKKGIAADEIKELSQEIKKKFPNRYPAESTPALFINGRMLVEAQPLEKIIHVIDDELMRK